MNTFHSSQPTDRTKLLDVPPRRRRSRADTLSIRFSLLPITLLGGLALFILLFVLPDLMR